MPPEAAKAVADAHERAAANKAAQTAGTATTAAPAAKPTY